MLNENKESKHTDADKKSRMLQKREYCFWTFAVCNLSFYTDPTGQKIL